jgi:hypothetical protein
MKKNDVKRTRFYGSPRMSNMLTMTIWPYLAARIYWRDPAKAKA